MKIYLLFLYIAFAFLMACQTASKAPEKQPAADTATADSLAQPADDTTEIENTEIDHSDAKDDD